MGFAVGEERAGAVEDGLGVEGFADFLGLPGFFEMGKNLHAEEEETFPRGLFSGGSGEGPGLPGRGVDGGRGFAGNEIPRLVGGEREQRREHLAEADDEAVQRGLRRAAARRMGGVGVEPVFDGVVVHRAEFDRGELAEALIDDVELVGVVGLDEVGLEFGEAPENPAVEAGQVGVGDGVTGGVEVVEIRKLVAQRVAEEAIGLGDFFDAVVTDPDVAAIVLGRDPEAHDIRAELVHVAVGGLGFFVRGLGALGDFFLLLRIDLAGFDHEAVGEHGLVRGRAVAGEREEQRGLEPPAVLVGAFEVNVGLPIFGRAAMLRGFG